MEWLANLSIQWVLVAIALLTLARTILTRRFGDLVRIPALALELIDAALLALVIVFLVVRPFFIQAYFIPSESMHPTLMESDRILVNKLIYRIRPPRRGEMLVFRPPDVPQIPDPTHDYIKRVIGLPGDGVEVVPQRILVDGRTLLRLTRKAASEQALDTFPEGAHIGFTLALEGGSAFLRNGEVVVAPSLGREIRIRTYRTEDRLRLEGESVYLNDRPILTTAFGVLEESTDLTQWGGDAHLVGRAYQVNGELRLILVQGAALSVAEGHVRVNGSPLTETYLAEAPAYAMSRVRIPQGAYWMMGDNRNHSLDSHVWGPLLKDRVIGRAEAIFWPPNRMRWLH